MFRKKAELADDLGAVDERDLWEVCCRSVIRPTISSDVVKDSKAVRSFQYQRRGGVESLICDDVSGSSRKNDECIIM